MISVGHPERAGGLEGITDTATLRSLLTKLVWEKEMWLAAVRGELAPEPDGASLVELQDRHTAAAGEFERLVGTVLDEGRGDETFIDATCDPPESFTFTGMIAHVLTFAAYRRTLAVGALIDADVTDLGIGNPITFRADGTAHGDAPQ
jgi:AraC family transcriptional regulator